MSLDAERIARVFHETYEQLAPSFSYETRADSAVPWMQVPRKNRMLMIATMEELLDRQVITVPQRCPYVTPYGRCARNENHRGFAHLAPTPKERNGDH